MVHLLCLGLKPLSGVCYNYIILFLAAPDPFLGTLGLVWGGTEQMQGLMVYERMLSS